jgi:hypothetical protein
MPDERAMTDLQSPAAPTIFTRVELTPAFHPGRSAP